MGLLWLSSFASGSPRVDQETVDLDVSHSPGRTIASCSTLHFSALFYLHPAALDMATADVEFNFLCADRSLRYTHPLPATLVHTGGDPRSDAAYQQQLWNSTSTILASYGDECFEHSTKICVNCNGAAVTPLMAANYYLHLSPPRIFVNVNPACNSKACEREIRLGMQSTLAAAANFPLVGAAPNGPLQDTPPLEVLPCPVCQKTESVRKCTGCGVVAYCSEDHQRAHWKYHKKMCVKTKSRQSS